MLLSVIPAGISSAQNADSPADYMAAALANAQAIRSYDGLVITEETHIPPKEEQDKNAGFFLERIERILFDYDAKAVFYAQKQTETAVDPTKVPELRAKLPFVMTTLVAYVDGKVYGAASQRFATVESFAREYRIPPLDLACVNGLPYRYSEATRDEHIATVLRKPMDNVTVTSQPDGTVAVVATNEVYSNHWIFDPSKLIPRRFSRKMLTDSSYPAGTIATERRFKFQTRDNINLLIQTDYETAPNSFLPNTIAGTQVVKWLQLNKPGMVIPTFTSADREKLLEEMLNVEQPKPVQFAEEK
jgi:hypothetical protein